MTAAFVEIEPTSTPMNPLRIDDSGLSDPQHVGECLDARAQPRLGGLGVATDEEYRERVLAGDALHGGHRVDLGHAAEGLEVHDAVVTLTDRGERASDALGTLGAYVVRHV